MKKLFLEKRIYRFCILSLLISGFSWAQANPTLTGVDTSTTQVTITNLGDETQDISSYWVCLGPGQYRQLSALDIVSGDYDLQSDESVTFIFPLIEDENNDGAGGLGLFSTNSFGSVNPSIYVDFMQWGGSNQDRSAQAVTAGLWDSVSNFVGLQSPYTTESGGSAAAWMGTCAPDAAEIQIIGGGTEATICANDGEGDPIDVEIVGMGVGANNGWVITDQATGEILGLPPGPPFDLEGVFAGVCDVWYIRYEDGLTGLSGGANISDLEGCYDLSNPVSITRNAPDAAEIQIAGSTDTEISICTGDGEDDFIDVEIIGEGVGANNGWVITDNATGEILGLPTSSPFNLEGTGEGVCSIWYIRYEDGLTGLEVGGIVGDLEGCYDLSNPIEVTRLTGDDCEVLSTNEINLDDAVVIYPNPVIELLTIETSTSILAQNITFQLYDAQGRIVREITQNTTANVSNLSQGVYFLRIIDQSSGSTIVKRIIKR